MIGIKNEVKTDWKNLMHGKTRIVTDAFQTYRENRKVWALGTNSDEFPKTGNVCLSYHAKWRNYYLVPRIASASHWSSAGNDVLEKEGEVDVVWVSPIGNFDTTESFPYVSFFASTPSAYTEGGERYIEFSEIMLNAGDTPLPYIDSDELKSGGAILRITITPRGRYSAERRAAA